MIKKCSRCKEEKSTSDFYKWKYGGDGLKSACKECLNKDKSLYYKNSEKCRNRTKKYDKDKRKELKIEVMSHYSNGQPTCKCCGEDEYEFLSIDHTKKNGKEHRKQGIASKALYRWLKKNNYPKEYRVLCMNCNLAYGIDDCCPHQFEDYKI